MRRLMPSLRSRARTAPIAVARLLAAAAVGVAAALLVSCGSSAGTLIPAADAGPLQSDFEAVAHAAESGSGSCSATETAILKTEQDFGALPSSLDGGLRNTLHQGITNLRKHALELCKQPLAQPTTTTSTAKTTPTTPTTTTPTVTQTTPTQTTPTTTTPTTTTPTTTSPGGGTPAPGAGETPPSGGAGGVTPGEGAAAGAGGQEGGK
jgi:hypothetical protein